MDSPIHRLLEASVSPPVDDLDAPPAPDDGEITNVEFGYEKDAALDRDRQACQACGEPVAKAEPHVKASVWVGEQTRTGPRLKNPVFCDRECWASWAGR